NPYVWVSLALELTLTYTLGCSGPTRLGVGLPVARRLRSSCVLALAVRTLALKRWTFIQRSRFSKTAMSQDKRHLKLLAPEPSPADDAWAGVGARGADEGCEPSADTAMVDTATVDTASPDATSCP